jgi:hypothetical protein
VSATQKRIVKLALLVMAGVLVWWSTTQTLI